MTTILAIKQPLMMLADSLANDGDMRRLTTQKMHKCVIPLDADSVLYDLYTIPPREGTPALMGYSGETQAGMEFFHWCRNGLTFRDRPRFDREHGINALILLVTGTLLRFDSKCFPFEIEEPHYAIGSGRDFVLGALAAYKDSACGNLFTSDLMRKTVCEAAMQIAIDLDIYTAGPIHMLTLP